MLYHSFYKKLSVLVLGVAMMFSLLAAVPAGAQIDEILNSEELDAVTEQSYNVDAAAPGGNQIEDYVVIIINSVLGLLGIIFLVLIIYAGFLWMTAGGNDEQVGKAKGLLTNAIIGVVIIVAAYAISFFVLNALINPVSN